MCRPVGIGHAFKVALFLLPLGSLILFVVWLWRKAR